MRKGAFPRQVQTVEKGFETRDIALSVIIRWIITLFIFAGVASAISFGMFKLLAPSAPTTARLPFTQRRPPSPVIQPLPRIDLKTFRAEENKTLTSYNWVDKNAGLVSIPIDKAIQLTAQGRQPAPVTSAAPAPSGTQIAVPQVQPSAPVNAPPEAFPPANQKGVSPGVTTIPPAESHGRTEGEMKGLRPAPNEVLPAQPSQVVPQNPPGNSAPSGTTTGGKPQ